MIVLRLWLRRGLGPPLAILMTGFVLASLLSQPSWRLEYDWASRLTAASLLVLAPIVAASATYDTAQRFRPIMAELSRGAARSRLQIALPSVAVVIWAVMAYIVSWLVAGVLVLRAGGIGPTDWWVFAEIIVPIFAAGLVGLLIGMSVSGRLAAPVAAVAVVATLIVAAPWGRGPFEAVTTYGTPTGVERTPIRALAAVAGAAAVGLAAFLGADEYNRVRPPRRLVLGASFACLLIASVLPSAWPWHQDIARFTSEPYGCVGTAPSVCGPRSRLPLLRPVQASLSAAYRTLAGTDFVKPASFRVTRLDHYSELNGAAPLDFDPANIQHGRYAQSAVVDALLRPHQCRELFGAASSVPILEADERLMPWLNAVLSGRTPARPVPPSVASDFRLIENCTPMTGDL